jgi:DNA-binding transcriptional LysR family regulator
MRFARTLIRVAERAREAVTEHRLSIGASSNIGVYLLQPLVGAFQRAAHFNGPLDIQIGTNLDTVKRLENAEVDIALMEWWDDRPNFDARIWRRERLVVIVPPEHPWARRRSIVKTALLAEPMIGGEPGTGTARILQQALGIDAKTLKISLQLGSTEAVKQAVRAGLGISITLASSVRDEVRTRALHALDVRDVSLSKALFAVVPRGLAANAPACAFAASLRA